MIRLCSYMTEKKYVYFECFDMADKRAFVHQAVAMLEKAVFQTEEPGPSHVHKLKVPIGADVSRSP